MKVRRRRVIAGSTREPRPKENPGVSGEDADLIPMEQKRDFADPRLLIGCTYCGGLDDTRDHVPSRVLLDPPFPENLPVVKACFACNNGFSKDEEYVACLLEATLAGTTDPEQIGRPGVAEILRRAPALRARLERARVVRDGKVAFGVEEERVRNVVLKLARGHAAYDLSQPCRDAPATVWWAPRPLMSEAERDAFDASHVLGLFGEVGSRQMQRLVVAQVTVDAQQAGFVVNDWVDVQDDVYRYLAIEEDDAITIKLVLREYLACQVTWAQSGG